MSLRSSPPQLDPLDCKPQPQCSRSPSALAPLQHRLTSYHQKEISQRGEGVCVQQGTLRMHGIKWILERSGDDVLIKTNACDKNDKLSNTARSVDECKLESQSEQFMMAVTRKVNHGEHGRLSATRWRNNTFPVFPDPILKCFASLIVGVRLALFLLLKV
ncbi:hypothetical protein O3P69_020904 [Scylla paramamosain]|uniref:Uncharacterized protein n=1 Tax=Scylla paramamosain TaxID=85552 RepID=A0AAW0TNJ2_SCYPA